MFIEFTTTITHRIGVGGPKGIESIDHTVDVDAGEAVALGTQALMMIVKGGCQAAINSIDNGQAKTVLEEFEPLGEGEPVDVFAEDDTDE